MIERFPLYQVDAFTDRVFGGNPAAVCPLVNWLPAATMQAIAAENNLSETVFFVARPGEPGAFDIRWFSPTIEIDLAGHPTLAAAFIVLTLLMPDENAVRFRSRAGDWLTVTRQGDRLTMDFPARPARLRPDLAPRLAEAFARPVEAALAARDAVAVLADEAAVRALDPDLARIAAIDALGVIATAPGDDCDFVSRFFAPRAGIAEDPVTGSAHCTLVPYWAERLGRRSLFARQVSARGGELWCEHAGDRVHIGGRAVLYLQGSIILP
jgi:PhzF family phenazine biosynthesis protein